MTTAVRAQMTVDMMHDAIHADVVTGLLAASQGKSDKKLGVIKEFEEHQNTLIDAYKKSQAGTLSPQTREIIQTTTPIVSRYLASAKNTIDKAFADPSTSEAEFAKFLQDFELLEKNLAEIGNKIELSADATQKAGEQTIDDSLIAVGGFSAICTILLFLFSILNNRRIQQGMEFANKYLANIATGDFREQEIPTSHPLEIKQLAKSIGDTRISLHEIMASIIESSNALMVQANEIRQSVSELAHISEEQNASAERAASAAEEISSSFSELNQNTQHSKNTISTSGDECEQGISAMHSVVNEMQAIVNAVGNASTQLEELEQRSRGIEIVTNTIKEIANQTSLLALNAAIEAARAGEEGRGFAIVADEVRKLADRTGSSTVEISNMVGEVLGRVSNAANDMQASVSRIKSGMNMTETANQSMLNIANGTKHVIETVCDMSVALNEQDIATRDIATAISLIAHKTEENYEIAQRASQSARELDRIAEKMRETTQHFKF